MKTQIAAVRRVSLLFLLGCALASFATAAAWRGRVEADWLQGEEIALRIGETNAMSTAEDAAGGCDGIRNGEWGFHTAQSDKPWWQVDLGTNQELGRVVIWNRTAQAEQASRIRILLSHDGKRFREVYQHAGAPFLGFADRKPLSVALKGESARFVRVALPGKGYLHLDEVEVFGAADPERNLALKRPAEQSSISQWSTCERPAPEINFAARIRETLDVCERLAREFVAPETERTAIERIRQKATDPKADARALFLDARKLQRKLALSNPLLRGVDTLLFTKKVPASFNHMSDQYYGWWSKPGGGIFLLRGFLTHAPQEQCITASFKNPGSFLRPTLSYDGSKVLFAWCRHYPDLAAETNKLDKANVPEDAFYHLFEMKIDGSDVRQITRGKYDDFDGRYLPDGRIVFLSTRRGQSLQAGRESAARTLASPDLPDCYVRCGGGPERPVAVYTLHTINSDGSDLCAISPFEMFEWTPEIARDGSIMYSRWDYIDRWNMPYMGLWAINPDGSNARALYKNYTLAPHCTFEARPIPGSHKIVFTASAHHAQTMGSLVLLDPSVDTEGTSPITRLTPEVAFPEIEGWPLTSYASPWPLSERFYLVAWGAEGKRVRGPGGWNRWHAVQRPDNGMSVYLYDAETHTRELIWSDPDISTGDPIPVQPRERPPVVAMQRMRDAAKEGTFLLADVYRGLPNVQRGTIQKLRLVAVPAKTHPTMNFPALGITRDDPGKCVLGTVPVDPDGSAYFRAPAGVILFFQALDKSGIALQTMRSVTHVQPGQTLSCIGCHEHRQEAPAVKPLMASMRPPSRVTPGPEGSWPLRFDGLVQPILDAKCVSCHQPGATNAVAARFDLRPEKSYEALVSFGKPSLREQVMEAYHQGASIPGSGIAQKSKLFELLLRGHEGVDLDDGATERLLTWLDTYAQRLGHFSDEQERELSEFQKNCADLLEPRLGRTAATEK